MSGKPDKSGAKPAYQNYRDIKSQEQSAHGRTEIGYERGGKKTGDVQNKMGRAISQDLHLVIAAGENNRPISLIKASLGA